MRHILPTVDRLLSQCRPLNQVIEALVLHLVPRQMAVACCSSCGSHQYPCGRPGCVTIYYYCRVNGKCVFSCRTGCLCP